MAQFIHLADEAKAAIVPRGIRPKEIVSIYKRLKVSGWRFYSEAKGRAPCGCPYCLAGQPFSKRIREAFEAEDAGP